MGRVAKVELNFVAQKPTKIPQLLKTWGDHLKKRRLELRLTQEQTARLLGVAIGTFRYWEDNVCHPRPMFIPRIVTFLGYIPPFVASETIGQKIRLYRLVHGLSKENFAPLVRVHPSTVKRWEESIKEPQGKPLEKVKELLATMMLRDIKK